MYRIDADSPTPCGWAIRIDGKVTCSINPPPKDANPRSRSCPALRVEECCRAWQEHANCPRLESMGAYGKRRKRIYLFG